MVKAPTRIWATAPRQWPGETVVCMASGPSLTREDVEYVRGKARVIVINDAVKLAPWADVLYSSDNYWFPRHRGVPNFAGQKYAIAPRNGSWHPFQRWPEIQVLANTGVGGLELAPTGLRTGQNSGYAAINLAVHFGALTVLLLGYDLGLGPKGEAHFDGQVLPNSQYHLFRKHFDTLVTPLQQAGVRVVNCSRRTTLRCFPRRPLMEALSVEVAA